MSDIQRIGFLGFTAVEQTAISRILIVSARYLPPHRIVDDVANATLVVVNGHSKQIVRFFLKIRQQQKAVVIGDDDYGSSLHLCPRPIRVMALLQALQAALLNPIPTPTAVIPSNGPDTVSRDHPNVFSSPSLDSVADDSPITILPGVLDVAMPTKPFAADLMPAQETPPPTRGGTPVAPDTEATPEVPAAPPSAAALEQNATSDPAGALVELPAPIAAASPAEGATPAPPASVAVPAAPLPTTEAVAQAADVLIVDDSALASQALLTRLARHGLRADVAHSGVQALAQAHEGRYLLVFLDVNMPNMDGYTVCRTLKRRRPSSDRVTHVVMLTSRDRAVDKIRGKMVGCDGYLTKPLTDDALQTTLRRFGLLRASALTTNPSIQFAS